MQSIATAHRTTHASGGTASGQGSPHQPVLAAPTVALNCSTRGAVLVAMHGIGGGSKKIKAEVRHG